MAKYIRVDGVTYDKAIESLHLKEFATFTREGGDGGCSVWKDGAGNYLGFYFTKPSPPLHNAYPWRMSKSRYNELVEMSLDEYETNLLLEID